MGIKYKAGGAMTTSVMESPGRQVETVGVEGEFWLTGVGIKSGIVEGLDQRPLCFAGRGIHLEVASYEKLASHGSWWLTVLVWVGNREKARGRLGLLLVKSYKLGAVIGSAHSSESRTDRISHQPLSFAPYSYEALST